MPASFVAVCCCLSIHACRRRLPTHAPSSSSSSSSKTALASAAAAAAVSTALLGEAQDRQGAIPEIMEWCFKNGCAFAFVCLALRCVAFGSERGPFSTFWGWSRSCRRVTCRAVLRPPHTSKTHTHTHIHPHSINKKDVKVTVGASPSGQGLGLVAASPIKRGDQLLIVPLSLSLSMETVRAGPVGRGVGGFEPALGEAALVALQLLYELAQGGKSK